MEEKPPYLSVAGTECGVKKKAVMMAADSDTASEGQIAVVPALEKKNCSHDQIFNTTVFESFSCLHGCHFCKYPFGSHCDQDNERVENADREAKPSHEALAWTNGCGEDPAAKNRSNRRSLRAVFCVGHF